MKKKFLTLFVLTTFAALAFGCGKKEETERVRTSTETVTEESVVTTSESVEEIIEEEVDYSALYDEILQQDFDILCDTEVDFEKYEDLNVTGLIEASMYMDKSEAVSTIGYAIEDITGDGIPELIISYIDSVDGDILGNDVINVYSIVDGNVINIVEGWGRNSYRYIGENSFFNVGSGGAAYSMLAKYSIAADGSELVCDECYFTSDEGNANFEISYYYNTTGEWDEANSELVTEDDFYAFENQWEQTYEYFELIPFSKYGDVVFTDDMPIIADYSEYIMSDFDYVEEEYVFDESDYQVGITLYTTEDVTDLEFYELQITDYDENGIPNYDMELLASHGDLSKDTPVSVFISFPGDSPTFGVSFIDSNNQRRYFSIGQSGYDSAIVVEEF